MRRGAPAPPPVGVRALLRRLSSEARDIEIRAADAADAPAIAEIYNQGIDDRQATFQTRSHAPGELERRLAYGGGVLIVAEAGGAVVGWASFSPYDDPAEYYSGVAQATLYVRRDMRGRGIGARLLSAIADAARDAGRHKLTAKIFTTNGASVALFRRCGWDDVGVHRRTGSSTARGAMWP